MNQLLISNFQSPWVNTAANNHYAKVFFAVSYSPVKFNLFGRITDEWEIIQPLLVTLEQDEDGYYVLSDELFLMYGEGTTEIKAKEDYVSALIDYYLIIQEKSDQGDEPSQAVFQRIREYLQPINQ